MKAYAQKQNQPRQEAPSSLTRPGARLQAKLKVNPPGDIYEQEADRVANQVMNMPEPQLGRTCACDGACPRCLRDQQAAEHPQRQRVETNGVGETAEPPFVSEVLRSSDQPLDPQARRFMEPRFGYNFSQVRVHADSRADESARHVNAIAYTLGRHIIFGAGRYKPASAAGRLLLAHELTHVVQQGSAEASTDIAGEHKHDPTPVANSGVAGIANLGFRGIQRQVAKPEQSQTEPLPLAQALLALKQLTLDLNDKEKWDALATHDQYLPKGVSLNIYSYFSSTIKAGLITFETITVNQRKVFSILPAPQKEELRKAALPKSNLFQVINKLVLNADAGAEKTAELTAARLSPDAVAYIDSKALANDFMSGSIVAEALVTKVTDTPMANEPLAEFVRQTKKSHPADSGRELLRTKTYPLACGIVNLFAVATSRGNTKTDKGETKSDQPTKEAAIRWLGSHIFDLPPHKALLLLSNGKFLLQSNQVLTELSKTGQKPRSATEPKPMELTKKDSPALFQESLEKSAGQADTRLGIVQGKGKFGHMYLVFKDMDGIWYTMDAYVNLADWPGGGLPLNDEYAKVKLSHKLIVD